MTPQHDMPAARTGRSLWAGAWRRLRRNPLAMACLAVIAAFVITALYGELVYWRYHIVDADPPRMLAPARQLLVKLLRAERVAGQTPPYQRQDLDQQYRPPSAEHWMGTDGLGRDVFSRVVQGVRIAFQVGIITSLIAIPIGVLLGCLAGYFGGRTDDLIVWLYSTFACMPTLLFVLAIAMVAGRGLRGVYLGIGLTTWVGLCRLIRGEVMKHKERTYVRAARALGVGHFRVIFRHILPNVFHLVIITFSVRFPAAIGTEVIMSFLGIGVQGEPSWGIMISNARLRLWYGVWWELGFATLAIFLVVLAFNLFGDALRDALDPRLRTSEG
ncbi:MAG: ABC transporter permease [Kiritimatiellae bacterium]|nr:ABC transporter permease [Kiritimatiellia bacterium]